MLGKCKMAMAVALGAALMVTKPLSAQEAKPIDMVAAIPPIAAYLPIMIGIEKGFYKEAGINLTINPNIVGAQLVPAVLSGSVQTAGSIWPLFAIAVSQGLPLKTVSGLAMGGDTTETDEQQLVVLAKSDIKSGADLAGKTVAINTLRGLSEVGVRTIAEKAGAAPASVKITPVLFPNMLGVLRAGTVDAAAMVEPFLTVAKEQEDLRVIAGAMTAIQPSTPTSTMIMSKEFIDKNPDLVARFQKATRKAVEYCAAAGNQAEIRSLLVKYTQTPPGIASKMILPRFSAFHDLKSVQAQLDAFVKFGIVEKKLDISGYDAQLPPQ